jgi:uncharacterized protein YndB with AHSA1/START domain
MNTTTDHPSTQQTITIQRVFNLPVADVWKAWTDPESFKKWWGPATYSCPSCRIDLKEGGSYLYCMRSAGGKDIWGTGIYEEIIPQKKLVYTDSFADSDGNVVSSSYYDMPEMPLEVLVTVEFEEVAGKTTMVLQHNGLPEEMADECIKGWQSSFDKLEANVK